MKYEVIYYGLLVFYILIGIIALMIAPLRFKFTLFSEDELMVHLKMNKKGMLIYSVIMILLPLTLLPLTTIFSKGIRLILFIILFLTISASLAFSSHLQRYCSIRKTIRYKKKTEHEKKK
jgi:hypothetical protein